VIRIRSNSVREIHAIFAKRLKDFTDVPTTFADDPALHSWFDDGQKRIFEHNVRRGLYIKMNDAQVQAARRALSSSKPIP